METPARVLPLRGVTVVALEQAVAAPFATRQLADLGAPVIKVERPQGGDFARHYDSVVHGLSSQFVWLNRSKESLTLNLQDPRGKQVLAELLRRADVFVSNLAPGALERLQIAPDIRALSEQSLIACEISGYGKGGPHSDRKAYDLLISAKRGSCPLRELTARSAKWPSRWRTLRPGCTPSPAS